MCGASAGLIIYTQANANGDKESQWLENKALFWPLQAIERKRDKPVSENHRLWWGIFSPLSGCFFTAPSAGHVYVLLFHSLPNRV